MVFRSPNVGVKEADVFKFDGGLVEDWGRDWKRIEANGIGHAIRIGNEMMKKNREDDSNDRRGAIEAMKRGG